MPSDRMALAVEDRYVTSSESPAHPDAPRAGGETPRWLEALDDAIGTADAEANDVTQKARFRSAGRDTAVALRELRASLLERHRDGAGLIAAERARQVSGEGWTPEHDDHHDDGEMALAGAIYAWPRPRPAFVKQSWPWHRDWWKPTIPDTQSVRCGCRAVDECTHGWASTEQAQRAARIRDLVKAGALIAAEIDRLQRASAGPSPERASK